MAESTPAGALASERPKVRLTFTFDPSDVFDGVKAVGDGGSALGTRIVQTMLSSGRSGIITAVGMATYGVTVEPSAALAPPAPAVPESVRRLSEAATQGEWYTKSEKCDGSYGSGEDGHEGYLAYSIVTDAERPHGNPGVIAETSNSTLGVIHEEWNEDDFTAWDDVAKNNTAFICAAVNYVRTLLAATPSEPAGDGGGTKTDDLVDRFAAVLKAKLRASEAKYGWQNGWLKNDWSADRQRDLMRHVGKGDPLDVAAYAAFCWHHGWPTAVSESAASGASERPETTAEHFIQAAIDRAPEPLKRLGRYLADVLDEDQFKTAERMLLGGIAHAAGIGPAPLASAGAVKEGWSYDVNAAPQDRTRVLLYDPVWLHPVIGFFSPGGTDPGWREHGSRQHIYGFTCWRRLDTPAAPAAPEPAAGGGHVEAAREQIDAVLFDHTFDRLTQDERDTIRDAILAALQEEA